MFHTYWFIPDSQYYELSILTIVNMRKLKIQIQEISSKDWMLNNVVNSFSKSKQGDQSCAKVVGMECASEKVIGKEVFI